MSNSSVQALVAAACRITALVLAFDVLPALAIWAHAWATGSFVPRQLQMFGPSDYMVGVAVSLFIAMSLQIALTVVLWVKALAIAEWATKHAGRFATPVALRDNTAPDSPTSSWSPTEAVTILAPITAVVLALVLLFASLQPAVQTISNFITPDGSYSDYESLVPSLIPIAFVIMAVVALFRPHAAAKLILWLVRVDAARIREAEADREGEPAERD